MHGLGAPFSRHAGRGILKIPGSLFIPGAHEHDGIGGGRNFVAEAPADGFQLWNGLQGKQERHVAAPRRLQDLSEIGVGERRELIQHNADHRQSFAQPIMPILVTFSDHQLQVLQQHPSQGGDGPAVAIGVQRHEQDEFPVDHFIEGQQVVIGAGDDGKLIFQKRH